MSGNTQHKLNQVRKPRVHITVDVDAKGSSAVELPFVVGVMGDFSGDQRVKRRDGEVLKTLPSFKDRNFVAVHRDNFDKVMEGMSPGLNFTAEDKLGGDEKGFQVDLRFDKMADFGPAGVAKQVPQLQALLEWRAKLHDLLSRADRSDALTKLLEEVLRDEAKRRSVAQQLGLGDDGAAKPEPGPATGEEPV